MRSLMSTLLHATGLVISIVAIGIPETRSTMVMRVVLPVLFLIIWGIFMVRLHRAGLLNKTFTQSLTVRKPAISLLDWAAALAAATALPLVCTFR